MEEGLETLVVGDIVKFGDCYYKQNKHIYTGKVVEVRKVSYENSSGYYYSAIVELSKELDPDMEVTWNTSILYKESIFEVIREKV